LLDLNPALEKMLGWNADGCRGQSLAHCLQQAIADPAQLLLWTAALHQAAVQGRTTSLDLPAAFQTGHVLTHQTLLTQVWGWEYGDEPCCPRSISTT
jgi:hypothetical protein